MHGHTLDTNRLGCPSGHIVFALSSHQAQYNQKRFTMMVKQSVNTCTVQLNLNLNRDAGIMPE